VFRQGNKTGFQKQEIAKKIMEFLLEHFLYGECRR
jgi:hypothetical protein